jgi:DNA-binding Lrp family transcriptional regulator
MKKKQRLAIDDALNSALKPPTRKPSDNLNSLLSQYAPAPEASKETSASGTAAPEVKALEQPTPAQDATPAHQTTPAHGATPAQDNSEPLHRAADAHGAAPAQQTTVAGFTRLPNDLLDHLLPTLDTYDQSLLIRLYRLARGFNSDTCRVSVPTLAKACNVSERQVRKSIVKLEGRGFIRRIELDFGNKNLALRGTTFKILISDATPARRTTPARQATPARDATPAQHAANKLNTQKENTQTQEPAAAVRVGSNFTIEECRRYAEHLRSTGQGINNPGGYATTIHRTGEADALIEAFLQPASTTPALLDATQCPDCQGSGFYYPSGPAGGVAKCKHTNLGKGITSVPD